MRPTTIDLKDPTCHQAGFHYPKMTHSGGTIGFNRKSMISSVKGTIPREARFSNKSQLDSQYVGPAKYNICTTDNRNSRMKQAKCTSVFKKPINNDAFENPQEY